MARNLEKDLLPVLFQAKMQLQSMQFEQLLVEQTTNSLCWIWEPCYGSQFCLTNCYAWGCSATQQFRRIFRMGKMSLWDRGWISVAVPECGKGLWQSKRPGSLSFRHCYKLQMRNELKWFLSCIFRLNCTYMTYDTWFMIYDTGCMIGGKYVYVYIETQIAARSKKTVDVSNGQAKASATSMEPVRLTIGEATALAKERVPWWMFAKGRVWFGVNDIYICTYHIYPSTGLFLMWYDSGSCSDFAAITCISLHDGRERSSTWEPSKISEFWRGDGPSFPIGGQGSTSLSKTVVELEKSENLPKPVSTSF